METTPNYQSYEKGHNFFLQKKEFERIQPHEQTEFEDHISKVDKVFQCLIQGKPNPETSKEILGRVLMQESLIDKNATIPSLHRLAHDAKLTDIYFGTGISNTKEISVGIPFDFLVYPLVANKIRNKIGNGHIHHLIADNHALLNNFDDKTVKKVASDYRKTVEDITDKIGIKNYHIYLSSEVSTDKNYKNLLERVADSSFENKYAKYEAADVEYFRKTRDVLLKLGWKFKGESKFDESVFDKQYSSVFGENIFPIYTACGKRFTDTHYDIVPYTLSKDDIGIRLVISKNEDVLKKVAAQNCSYQTINMLQNHYKSLIRLFEEATERIPNRFKTTWDKVQQITKFITN